MHTLGLVLVGVAVVVGLAGTILPVVPGALLVVAAIAVWAAVEHTAFSWTVLGLATAVVLAGQIVKYVIPERSLHRAGIPWQTSALGAVLAIVGFFVVPVVGMPLGFVLGIFASELIRLRRPRFAWTATKAALSATGVSILIEATTTAVGAGIWFGAVLLDSGALG